MQVADPVCVIVFRDPIANAVSLTDNAKKSAKSDQTQPMTVQRWLSAWEEGAKPQCCLLCFCSVHK